MENAIEILDQKQYILTKINMTLRADWITEQTWNKKLAFRKIILKKLHRIQPTETKKLKYGKD